MYSSLPFSNHTLNKIQYTYIPVNMSNQTAFSVACIMLYVPERHAWPNAACSSHTTCQPTQRVTAHSHTTCSTNTACPIQRNFGHPHKVFPPRLPTYHTSHADLYVACLPSHYSYITHFHRQHVNLLRLQHVPTNLRIRVAFCGVP